MMQSFGDNFRNSGEYKDRSAFAPFNTAMAAGMAWFDLMLNFQRQMQNASLQSFSSYSPTTDTRITGNVPQRTTTAGIQVVPVGEERLNVATHTVSGETTRVRRRVVSQPIEQQVTLREEKVVVERRSPTASEGRGNVLTETVVEMSDTHQVPAVWKSVHVAEEVVLRKQATQRTEKVRETVRRDVVDVEHDRQPAEVLAKEIVGSPVMLPHGDGQDLRLEGRQILEEVAEKKVGLGQPQPGRKA